MSKFLPEKKRLLEEVYEKASSTTTETSFNGILLHLERTLEDDFEPLSYKSFENYYKTIVENDEDYNIKRPILDNLSRYLEYDNFKEYCAGWKTIEHTIQQAISKIMITIINKPIFTLPKFLQQNGPGIVEMAFVLLLVSGGVVFSSNKVSPPIGFLSGWGTAAVEKKYMYWDEDRYMATDSSHLGPQIEVMPMERNVFIYQKKITRPDTLSVENAMGKVWYNKSNNQIEFFTSFGKHPENEKTLKSVTPYILDNYAGINAELAKN